MDYCIITLKYTQTPDKCAVNNGKSISSNIFLIVYRYRESSLKHWPRKQKLNPPKLIQYHLCKFDFVMLALNWILRFYSLCCLFSFSAIQFCFVCYWIYWQNQRIESKEKQQQKSLMWNVWLVWENHIKPNQNQSRKEMVNGYFRWPQIRNKYKSKKREPLLKHSKELLAINFECKLRNESNIVCSTFENADKFRTCSFSLRVLVLYDINQSHRIRNSRRRHTNPKDKYTHQLLVMRFICNFQTLQIVFLFLSLSISLLFSFQ